MDLDRVPLEVPTAAPEGRTSAYLLGDRTALLVDPAAEDDRLSARRGDVAHIAVTHHHPDHVGAVAAYAETCEATVWCRVGRHDAFAAATGRQPDRTFAEGTAIPTDQGDVVVRDTPGHAPEHVAFELPDGSRLLVGDLAVETGSVVVGAPAGDMRAYLSSLRRVRARKYDRLYPAHGPPIDDPDGTCRRLITHRLDREVRVLAAVEAGRTDPTAIREAAYEKDLTGVEDLATATVRAHLAKLAHEGRIDWDPERDRATFT